MRFKEFLLNEQQAYLAQKVGNILTAVHELRDDAKNLGTRDMITYSQRIVNQIRRVLHSSWPKEERPHLLVLQKVGVALMKSIEEKDDMPGIIQGVSDTLEKLVADLGTPINKLTPTEGGKKETGDKKGTGGTETKPPEPPQPPQAEKGGATAAGGAPSGPSNLDQSPQGTPPIGTGQDMAAPPLGGSSGPMDAF